MLIVVDSNKVFSALLSKQRDFDVFLFNSFIKKFEFASPEFMFFEINNNFNEILSRSKLSEKEVIELFKFLKEQIIPVPFKEFNRFINEAEKLAPHPKDIEYFALALSLNCGMWSNENAFRKQSKIKVYSTSELMKELKLE